MDKAVIRGQSATLICSSDNSTCAGLNSACGADQNGDGHPDGICIWNVLKESYFFREAGISAAMINTITDTGTGGDVTINWFSANASAVSYKVYYGESGKAMTKSQEFKISDYCVPVTEAYNCTAHISALKNGQSYDFRLTAVSTNRVESDMSDAVSATPTDQSPPAVPVGLNVTDTGSTLKFTWQTNNTALFYRIYRGVKTNLYGESYDSANNASTLSWDKAKLSAGNNYFAISSVDSNGNESSKSAEIIFFK
jgi:fibronectin type 3 domain-containing protein